MMDLHSKISLRALKDEPDRFEDFLAGIDVKKIKRIDELHPSKGNDAHYIFLIWVDEDDDDAVRKQIQRNARKNGRNTTPSDDWWIKVLPDTGAGLIVVSTWL